MRLAVVAAGFTPGEADQLRRAMGAWRRPGVIDQFRHKLIDGHAGPRLHARIRRARVPADPRLRRVRLSRIARRQLRPAGLCFGWLKRHYPAAFAAALLNSQPMGFYAPAQLVARRPRARRRSAAGRRELPATGTARWKGQGAGNRERGVMTTQYSVLSTRTARCFLAKLDRQSPTPGSVLPAPCSLLPPARPPHAPRTAARGGRSGSSPCRGERPYRSIDDFAHRTRFEPRGRHAAGQGGRFRLA